MSIPMNKEWQVVEGYEYEDLIYEKKYLDSGGVARLTMNRPQKFNAFTGQMIRHMYECMNDINLDPSIGVVILTGAGEKAFCTGGDVENESEGEFEDIIFLQCNNVILSSRKPIIAVVKGWAVGGGNHMAYCCDLTIAADNAKFAQGGPKVGSPATGWFVQYAASVVGVKRAREMWMLCRKYDAQQALAMGLVNTVVPLDTIDEEVDKWCNEILEKSPTCIQLLKATFDDEFTYRRYDESMDLQKRMFPKFQNSAEQKEAQNSFFEKRKPDFLQFMEQEYDEYLRNRNKIHVK
ncbi:1,4-dihydroxy-2-naphthoyl-CoA synthase [Desulfosarcina ovata subsp. sediminis]|uniref:1,4-dihydroxy-2-naphthoyl-CoA synthase n=1 Tax=Desulfosarcina ovata subsp. sediminis TaxID=885957 RepID=A0A5K7ZVB1_9BACT|nr:enoyl-CoA hydratase-related protein [Desulfosarcina ovata]BBO84182.1 1,4-dihydroxy-2-naphthoyl-CoA synthase [Desulfosarcina ovata subsp. sediminis]